MNPENKKPAQKRYLLPAKNDRNAYDRLFRDFYPRLIAYGELFVDASVAEDIVQDLMVYFWEQDGKLVIHTSLESYLFKSVYLKCLNVIKHHKVQNAFQQQQSTRLTDFEIQHFNPDHNDTIVNIFSNELKHQIDEAIAELSPKCREVFINSYIKELKNKEISKLMNISERTVETHMHQALKQLRIKLKDVSLLSLALLNYLS